MWKHILWKLPWNIVETFNLIIGLLSPLEASYLIFEPSFISDTLQLLIVANDEKIFAETENIFRYVKHLNVHTTDEVFKIKIIPLYNNKTRSYLLGCDAKSMRNLEMIFFVYETTTKKQSWKCIEWLLFSTIASI